MDEIFTLAEAAEYLKVTKITVKSLIDAGRIKAIKVGREYRLRESDILKLFEGGEDGEAK